MELSNSLGSTLGDQLLKKSLENVVKKLCLNSGVSFDFLKANRKSGLEFDALKRDFVKQVDVYDSAESIRQAVITGVNVALEAVGIGGVIEE